MIYTEHCILHGFWEISLLLPNFYQTCLILKSSLLLLIHSRPFVFLLLPYFIATVFLVHFLSLFSWIRRRQISTWVTCYLFIYYNKFPPDTTRNEIGWKGMFYAESIKHGVKAVTPSVNHTIGIRYIVREDWLSNGVVIKTNFAFQG